MNFRYYKITVILSLTHYEINISKKWQMYFQLWLHNKFLDVRFQIIDFVFKGRKKTLIKISTKGKALWDKKVKVAVTNMRYFARRKISRRLVHKKNFSLMWQVVFKLGYVFCHSRIPLLTLNELREKSGATIILHKFANKPRSNSHWLKFFGKCFSLVKT